MLPEFTRVAWASAELRAMWEPRIAAIRDAWSRVEVETVRSGDRDAALVFWDGRVEYPSLIWRELAPGRFLVTRAVMVADLFARAWAARQDDHIGAFLGFPDCCRAFFDRLWNEEQRRDTTLAMGPGRRWGCNILGRWLGVRYVPHLPCSWGCEATQRQAALYRSHWAPDALAWADEILAWPAEYSALHGIADIRWPVMKVVTNTDYTPAKQVVRWEGTAYPADAPHGLRFPFEKPRFTAVTQLGSFRQSVAAADPRTWTDNGFTSLVVMQAAHDVVRDVAGHVDRALDLGCGNGRLVQAIASHPFGVEGDRDRAGRSVVPVCGDRIEDLRWRGVYDLVLLMPGRLLEMSTAVADDVRQALRASTSRLVVYAYGDWLTRHGSLQGLTEAAGLRWRPLGYSTAHREPFESAAALLENF